jgi:mono/diheme cytochrome c family protein
MDAMKMFSLLTLSTVLGLAFATSAHAADGKALYLANCIKCHGDDGKGHTKLGKKLEIRDFTQAEVWNTFDDEDAFKAVKNGIKKDGELIMGYKLPDEEIKAMIDYMKTLKAAPPAAAPATVNTNAAAQP